jgi:hypothetical protein
VKQLLGIFRKPQSLLGKHRISVGMAMSIFLYKKRVLLVNLFLCLCFVVASRITTSWIFPSL